MSRSFSQTWSSLWTWLLTLALFVAIGAGAIALEKPVGQASGTVISAGTGKPLAGAEVLVTGVVTRRMLTAEDGTFHFYNLPAGEYYVSAKAHRFDPQYQENGITVKEGQCAEHLDFKLVRTQPALAVTNSQRVFTPNEPVRLMTRGTTAPSIEVEVYRLNLEGVLARDPELRMLHHPDIRSLQAQHLVTLTKQWRQTLPASANADENWFFKPVQLEQPEGAYVAVLSTQPEKGPEDVNMPGRLEASYWFNVTRLGLVAKRGPQQLALYCADLVTKKPVEGVKVSLYPGSERGVTGADGLVQMAAPRVRRVQVVGQIADSVALTASDWSNEEDAFRIYGYTDRPVYRPGQHVYFKATVRSQTPNGYGDAAGRAVLASLKDVTGAELATASVLVSSAGGVNGEFELPPDAALGEYNIELATGGTYDSIRFKVADYRKPEYKVEITPEKTRYVQGSKAKVHLLSSYYFGAPVPNAKLAVTVFSAPAYDNFNADEGFFSGFTDDEMEPVWGFGDVIQQTEGATDSDGKFDLEVNLPVLGLQGEDRFWTGDRVFTVAVEAIDASGRPVKAHQGFRVSQGDLKLSVQTDEYLTVGKKPIGVNLKTQNYDDKPVPADVRVVLERLDQVKETTREGDEVWHTKRVQTWQGAVRTDAHGLCRVVIPPQGPGDYSIGAELTDPSGHRVRSDAGAWVASGDEPFAAEPATRSGALKIVLDKKVYVPGQKARALVISPVPDVPVLVTLEGKKIHDVRVMRLHGNTGLMEFNVSAAYEPNAFICGAIVNGKELIETSRSLNVTPARTHGTSQEPRRPLPSKPKTGRDTLPPRR